jgi:hypothetical protein
LFFHFNSIPSTISYSNWQVVEAPNNSENTQPPVEEAVAVADNMPNGQESVPPVEAQENSRANSRMETKNVTIYF